MIGKIIKTMRNTKGFSQKELSKITFIGRSTISDYERMKTDINFENLEKIANACGYDILFINKNNPELNLSSRNIDREEI